MNENGTVNKVILAGEISRAPCRHKNSASDKDICFLIITKERFFQNGQETEHAEQHTIRLAENKFAGQLIPGLWLHIEGRLKTFSFVDEQSIRRYKTEIIAVRIQPIGPGDSSAKRGLVNTQNDHCQEGQSIKDK
jgi:single-strand DNA-binding protein